MATTFMGLLRVPGAPDESINKFKFTRGFDAGSQTDVYDRPDGYFPARTDSRVSFSPVKRASTSKAVLSI